MCCDKGDGESKLDRHDMDMPNRYTAILGSIVRYVLFET